MSSPIAAAAPVSRRILLTVITLALAVAALAAPAFGSAAHASGSRPAFMNRSQYFVPNTLTPAMTRWYAKRMLGRVNWQRAQHGRRPLTMNTKLIKSAHAHNLDMAKHDEMSHQLPGEAYFADRISKTGYQWMSAGENIGYNSDLSLHGIYYLERVMYHEKAPNDGHRVNILSTSYRNVGIDVYYDKVHGKVWFTQDFGQPA